MRVIRSSGSSDDVMRVISPRSSVTWGEQSLVVSSVKKSVSSSTSDSDSDDSEAMGIFYIEKIGD